MKSNLPLTNTLEIQTGPLGRPFRLLYTQRDGRVPEKWVNGMYKATWRSGFAYTDTPGVAFEVIEGPDGGKRVEKL